MKRNTFSFLAAVAVFAAFPAMAQDRQEQVVDRIIAGEQQFLAEMKDAQPLVEAYIQELDRDFNPARDHYKLMRLDLTKRAGENSMTGSSGFKKAFPLPFRRPGRLTYFPNGWAQMAFVDTARFDRSTYSFKYLRREFLGEVRCLVFEVAPLRKKDRGRFTGDIWVDDRDYRIVRFNGAYSRSTRTRLYFHFDSWRVNVAHGVWAPAAIYVEEGNDPVNRKTRYRLKAQVRIFGYAAQRGVRYDELGKILIDAKTPVEDTTSKDLSPWQNQRIWERQAEQNVLDRLERSGLLAPKGEVDKVLDTVINNLEVTNHIDADVRCRVILTTPLEAFTVGNTIVVSRGLIDVLPDEASLAMALSEELANIALGRRVPTTFAFGDEIMFADRAIFDRLNMGRTRAERAESARKAVEILGNSPYKDKLTSAGLFVKAMESAMPALPNLLHANLGNQLTSRENLDGLSALVAAAPPLDKQKLDQLAALPLGGRVKVNVWTNEISLAKTQQYAITSAKDKMPFEVTPVMLPLTRVEMEADRAAPGGGR